MQQTVPEFEPDSQVPLLVYRYFLRYYQYVISKKISIYKLIIIIFFKKSTHTVSFFFKENEKKKTILIK